MRWPLEKSKKSPSLSSFTGPLPLKGEIAPIIYSSVQRLERFPRASSLIGVPLTAMIICAAANAVDDKKLWLPSKYAKQFLELKKAAEAAEALDRCVDLVSGTIDLDQSKPNQPIYRFLCRQENGRTYNEMVDGVSFKTLTTVIVEPKEPTPEELEAIRLAEEKRKEEERKARIAHLWGLCEAKLKEKTRLMADVSWLEPFPPGPELLEEHKASFYIQFDAISMDGVALKYEARCKFSEEDRLRVKISGRKDK